jgi:endonuclease/exonuclease/phosphatase family metal-dependent hydrolase
VAGTRHHLTPNLNAVPFRRRGALAVLVLLLTSCVRPAQTLTPVVARPLLLAVVTWNMGAGGGDLPRLVADLSSGRLTGVAVPHFVLLLQEATEPAVRQATAASSRAPLSTFFAPVRRAPRRTTGNAIVATTPLLEARVIDLPRERQPRAAAAAVVDVGGARVFVVSAHLENRLGWLRGLFGDRARERQAAALLTALPRDERGILGGDMNTMLGPGEPALDALLERFTDTPTDQLQPTFRDRLVLDHLFFDVPDGWAVARRVLEDPYGSDHHPVLGIIARAE